MRQLVPRLKPPGAEDNKGGEEDLQLFALWSDGEKVASAEPSDSASQRVKRREEEESSLTGALSRYKAL